MNFFKCVGFIGFSIMCSCNTPEDEKKIAYQQIKFDNQEAIKATSEKVKELLGHLDDLYLGADQYENHDIRCIAHYFNVGVHRPSKPGDDLAQFKALVSNLNSPASPSRISEIAKDILNAQTFTQVNDPESEVFKSAKSKIVDILKYHHELIRLNMVKGVLDGLNQ